MLEMIRRCYTTHNAGCTATTFRSRGRGKIAEWRFVPYGIRSRFTQRRLNGCHGNHAISASANVPFRRHAQVLISLRDIDSTDDLRQFPRERMRVNGEISDTFSI
jgi:hypothetical protein